MSAYLNRHNFEPLVHKFNLFKHFGWVEYNNINNKFQLYMSQDSRQILHPWYIRGASFVRMFELSFVRIFRAFTC